MHGDKHQLGLWDTVSLIIGIVIGAGIYETAPLVFRTAGGPWSALGIWALGGVLSLVGALCYAELAVTYPRLGGDYEYLRRAFGSWAGFLFGWCQLAVLMTGSIGMMAYIFADYAAGLWRLGPQSHWIFAGLAVIVLSVVHAGGIVLGKRSQNLLTLLKILGLGGIVVAGIWAARSGTAGAAVPSGGASGSFGLALIFVLYTYGGWNDAAMVTAEVNDNRRNIPRALILGTMLITVVYLVVNSAYLLALGFEKASQSKAIAADVAEAFLGRSGGVAMSLLVMVSALGAVSGLTYTGSRIYSSWGEDFPQFSALSRWHPRWRSPVISLALQAAITLALILLVGTAAGQGLINRLFEGVGLGTVAWAGRGGFETLLRCTAPVFWSFFLMTGISLFLLRWRDPTTPRGFRVPFYPLVPMVFCGMCGYMLYSATAYAGKLTLIGLAPVVAGLLVYGVFRPRVPAPPTGHKEPTETLRG